MNSTQKRLATKLKKKDIPRIRALYKKGWSLRLLYRKYNVSRTLIQRAVGTIR